MMPGMPMPGMPPMGGMPGMSAPGGGEDAGNAAFAQGLLAGAGLREISQTLGLSRKRNGQGASGAQPSSSMQMGGAMGDLDKIMLLAKLQTAMQPGGPAGAAPLPGAGVMPGGPAPMGPAGMPGMPPAAGPMPPPPPMAPPMGAMPPRPPMVGMPMAPGQPTGPGAPPMLPPGVGPAAGPQMPAGGMMAQALLKQMLGSAGGVV